MIELVIRGQASSLPAPLNRASFARWTDTLCALSQDVLEEMTPLVGGNEPTDTLRKLIAMGPELMHPGPALAAQFCGDRDAFITYAYRLVTIANYLDKRCGKPQTLDAWCRDFLHDAAAEDSDFAARFVTWCRSMIQTFGTAGPEKDDCPGEGRP